MIGSRTRINEVTSIFLIILIAGLFEEHKQQIIKADSLISYTLIVIAILLFSSICYRVSRRLYKWHKLNNSSMVSIDKMSGLDFERCVARLLSQRGYKYVTLTEKYDFGVDIVAEKHGIRWGVQVKRRNGLVKANAVRQAVTALNKYNCTRAMVITNGRYSKVASELARTNNCVLVDRNILQRWLTKTGKY